MPNESISKPSETRETGSEGMIAERIGSVLVGGALVALGGRLPSPAKIGAMVGGGLLLYWGATGARPAVFQGSL